MSDRPLHIQVSAPPLPDRKVHVEAPWEWGPGQALIGRLENLEYLVADRRWLGSRERILELSPLAQT
jgi:hypothetical protein